MGGGQWELKHVFVFRKLFLWREKEAERRDESPSYICRGSLLLDAAEFLPVTVSALMKLQTPLPASMRPSGACKSELAQGAGGVEGTGGKTVGEEEGTMSGIVSGTWTEAVVEGEGGAGAAIAVAATTTTENETEKEIATKAASEDSDDSHLHTHTGDTEECIGSKDDVVDLVAAVKAALRSWDAVMRKQNNSPATDRPDDSSPESYREKHVKRSTYHNKNISQNLDGKNVEMTISNANSIEKVDVTVNENVIADVKAEGGNTSTYARSPGSGSGSGVILDDSTIIAEDSIKNIEVKSTTNAENSVTNTSSSSSSSSIVKKTISGASITLICAATILSVGAFIFLRRKG